jgi:(1->4)-alpha-D-glucan 1-alpha-D-glucosylmutase
MPPAVPLATYRLQFTPEFGFDDAAAVVAYLQALGVSHLYASPVLKARAGSRHGYDVVDYGALNPELGGEAAFERLCATLARADIGLILDFVPNHMAIYHADNAWWLDVLEWGQASAHAAAFDIDWTFFPGPPRVLLPILGRPYGEALEGGEIELRFDAAQGSFSAWYYEHQLPIAPPCYGEILRTVVAAAAMDASPIGRALFEASVRIGAREPAQASVLKAELAALRGGSDVIGLGLRAYAAKSTNPAAMLALHLLLERQHYRLAHWRLAASEINYRRFFDITSLAGVRVEERATFTAVHALVRRLIAQGRAHGLRIDHVDGLWDPHVYFRRLERLIDEVRPGHSRSFYIVVEKVLAEAERLPCFTGVAGSTGYEWLNLISRLLLQQRGLASLEATWREASGEHRAFEEILIAAKRDVMAEVLAGEFAALLRLLAAIAAAHYRTRDYTGARLAAALRAFILHFPVYRTYLTPTGPSPEDRATVEATLVKARAAWIGADSGIFDFLRDALTLDLLGRGGTGYDAEQVRRFAFRVQQFTGPMMAKSLEDTAFYRYHRLLALNEVGGDPASGAIPVAQFHARMQERAAAPTQGLTATATHDTKRGEDARARLLALAELPDEWAGCVRKWRAINANLLSHADGRRIPSAAHEYMLYQALLGAWPLAGIDAGFVERMVAYAVKAAREGKEQTSWLAPSETYEAGLRAFVTGLLDPRCSPAFREDFNAFAHRIALIGALNSLVQLTLKATMPGVPDFFQGSELWDLSLVDPDNRRPVEFAPRKSALEALAANVDLRALTCAWPDGRIKLVLTHRILALRRQFAPVLAHGAYEPLQIAGRDSEEIIAFARRSGQEMIIIICARHFCRATDRGRRWPSPRGWSARITLPGLFEITNLIAAGPRMTSSELDIEHVLDPLPIAILHARGAGRANIS